MLVQWARVILRRPRTVLAFAILFMIVSVIWGSTVLDRLDGGGWEDPKSESARAAAFLRTNVDRADADVIALYTSADKTVDDPAFANGIRNMVAALPGKQVAAVDSFFTTGSDAFVSVDRKQTFIVIQLRGQGDDALRASLAKVQPLLEIPGLQLDTGGQVVTRASVEKQADTDLARAELISLPLLLLLLVFVFRSVVAALLPLLIGAFAVVGSMSVLRALTEITAVSAFAMNIVMLLGLGLAIDYSLFMVWRFREELRHGCTTRNAVGHTMASAGHTVLFSSLTVAGSLAGLLVFPQPFLRSMAMGGIAAALTAMLGALVMLPALLQLLGQRIDILSLPQRSHPGANWWARLARSVMRGPVGYLLWSVTVLLIMGAPFLHVEFSRPDASVLPLSEGARRVNDALLSRFESNQTKPIAIGVVMDGPVTSAQNLARLNAYGQRLASVTGVTRVVSPATIASSSTGKQMITQYSKGNVARVDVYFTPPAQSKDAQELVKGVRAEMPPVNATVLVGGETAKLVDLVEGRNTVLLPMLMVILCVTGLLLFIAFGSVVLSLKAILINTFSLMASFGAVVWIFQDGHFAHLIGAEARGSIDATQPVLMLATVFGLSMDYEVFLLSRIREAYLRTHSTSKAVAIGMQQTGPVITRAALLMVVVAGAFSTSDISLLKMVGAGMAVAIAVDATLVRGLLVPSAMQLMGNLNWWSPSFLQRLHTRLTHSQRSVTHASVAQRKRAAQQQQTTRHPRSNTTAHPRRAPQSRPRHHQPQRNSVKNENRNRTVAT